MEMFQGCYFENLDFLSKWNVIKVEDISMGYKKLNNIKGVKNWNVKNVKTFIGAFPLCNNLIDANDIKNWDMSNTEDIRLMFAFCKNLKNAGSLYKWMML